MASNDRATRSLAATVFLSVVVSSILLLGAWFFLSSLWSYPWVLISALVLVVLVTLFFAGRSFVELLRDDLVEDKVSTEQQKKMQVTQNNADAGVADTKGWRKAWRQPAVVLILLLSDVLLAVLAWLAAYGLQSILVTWEGFRTSPMGMQTAVVAGVFAVAVWIGLRSVMGLYPGYGLSSEERLRRHTYSVVGTLAVVSFAIVLIPLGAITEEFGLFELVGRVPRLLLALGFVGLLLLSLLVQGLARWGMWRLGIWGRPVVVIGDKDTSARTVKLLEEEWVLGYAPAALIDWGLTPSGKPLNGHSHEEAMTQAENLARGGGVDTIILATPYIRGSHLAPLVSRASRSFRHVLITPNLSGITTSAVVAGDLVGTLAVEIKHNLLSPWALRAKRVLDLGATVVGGALVLPLLLVIAILIYAESGRPIFYTDWRMGKDGVPFPCIKFRTMVTGAEVVLELMLAEDADLREEYVKYHKLRVDPRVTRVGRFLRRTSLDELPQLWNVLRGEMSLVGPRPYLPRESGDIGNAREEILRVPPGVTGPWQVSGRNNAFFTDRIEMDIHYVRDWSVWLDLVLLARTVRALFLDKPEPMQVIGDTDVRAAIAKLRGRERKGKEETEAKIKKLQRLLEV
jgi:Undecaprenyl-phosphate galactose phosphotransferase WbaP